MISVLYVDDEPALLEIGKLFLESSGEITVTTLLNARLALAEAANRHYDAILSDYQMPEMDGIELLKEVRRQFENIPFILFTGKGREEIVIQAINNGANFYVQKGGEVTSQFAELVHMIRVAVGHRRAIDELKNSEQHLADIIDFSPNPLFATDTTGHVIIWNKAIEGMTGIPAADMLGKGNYEYALPLYGERRPLLIDQIHNPGTGTNRYSFKKREGSLIQAESIVAYPKGEPRHFEGKVSLLYDKDHAIIGAIESLVDITRLKETETKLRTAYARQTTILEDLQKVVTNTKAPQKSVSSKREHHDPALTIFPDDLSLKDLFGSSKKHT
jgi:PAS domain S-box-containing protein